MRKLILTADKGALKWKTLPSKLESIRTTLGNEWTVDFLYKDFKPTIIGERINHAWFKEFITPYLIQGYDVVALHMSDAQRTKWGIQPTLRGANLNSNDFYGDFYFWADENTKRRGFNGFVQTCLHEMSHEYFQKTKLKDVTHEYHETKKDIRPLFKTFDWNLYRKAIEGGKKTFLQSILDGLKALIPQEKPEPFLKGNFRITQGFGVYNPTFYPRTKHHIGVDYGTPLSTLIYAPLSGKLTKSIGKETGIVATLETKQGTYQFLHLGHCAPDGQYEQGHVIGYTGNSGSKTTGPHVCVRLWKSKPDISVLTEHNFNNYLTDVSK